MTENIPEPLYCANHPQRETFLRCNRCNKPICTECAVSTPIGYRCKDCVRGQQKIFDTAVWLDYPLSFFIAAVLSFLGSRIASVMGFFTLFIAPIAGVIIAEAVRLVIRRRRSRNLFLTAVAGAVAGCLPALLLLLLSLVLGGGGSFSVLLPLAYQALYVFLVASTMYYRLSGIQVG